MLLVSPSSFNMSQIRMDIGLSTKNIIEHKIGRFGLSTSLPSNSLEVCCVKLRVDYFIGGLLIFHVNIH